MVEGPTVSPNPSQMCTQLEAPPFPVPTPSEDSGVSWATRGFAELGVKIVGMKILDVSHSLTWFECCYFELTVVAFQICQFLILFYICI